MAEPKSRVVVVGKLLLLVGLPLTVITSLFGAGVHWGFESRADILRIEKDWLGMEVEVPDDYQPREGACYPGGEL